jgi:hypothetical protein
MKKQSTVPRRPVVPVVQRRYLQRAVVALAVAVPVVAATAPVLADDQPGAGDTVVGELVQAWPEGEDPLAAGSSGHAPLSWIATEDGESVRVPTPEVAHLALGATVEVTLGRTVRDAGTTEHGLPPAQDVVAADVVAGPADRSPTR